MKSYDPGWMAEQAARVAWTCTITLDGYIEDIDAAMAAEDYATAVECAGTSLFLIGYCSLLLNGHQNPDGEEEMLTALTVHEPRWLDDLCALPAAMTADAVDAERARQAVNKAYRGLRGRVPFTVPMVRTPQGFFPSLRVASEVEKLRSALGLEPFKWDFD